MLDLGPLLVLRRVFIVSVDDAFHEEMGPPKPRLPERRHERNTSRAKQSTYLFLVFYHSAVIFFALSAFACDNRRVCNRDVEAPPQNPVDACNGVRDMVLFSLTRATGDINENSFVT